MPAREVLYRRRSRRAARIPSTAAAFPSELDGSRIRDLVAEGIYFDGVDWLAPLLGIRLATLLEHLPPGHGPLDRRARRGRARAGIGRARGRAPRGGRARARAASSRLARPCSIRPTVLDRLARARGSRPRSPRAEAVAGPDVIAVDARPQPSFGRKLDLLRGELRRLQELGYERILVCDNRGQAERLEEILGDDVASIEVGSIVVGLRAARRQARRVHRSRDLRALPPARRAAPARRARRRSRAARRSSPATTSCTRTTASASTAA